jgi:hypothetical protein
MFHIVIGEVGRGMYARDLTSTNDSFVYFVDRRPAKFKLLQIDFLPYCCPIFDRTNSPPLIVVFKPS